MEYKEVTRADRKAAHNEIVKMARHHALIYSGDGGVLTLMHPDIQDKEGVTEKCLELSYVIEIEEKEEGFTKLWGRV